MFGLLLCAVTMLSLAALITVSVSRKITIGSNTLTDSGSGEYSGSQLLQIDLDSAIRSNANLGNVAIDKDTLKAVYLLATVDTTIETNNASTPDNTIALTANVAYLWTSDMPSGSNPFGAADVTAIYVTNATAGTLKGYILHGS